MSLEKFQKAGSPSTKISSFWAWHLALNKKYNVEALRIRQSEPLVVEWIEC